MFFKLTKKEGEVMAYVKRVPPIKLVVSVNEFNNLIGVLTNNIDDFSDEYVLEIANSTKEKLLKYSVPKKNSDNLTEIEMRLYLNEAADIITQLLLYVSKNIKEIDYMQLLNIIRENFEIFNN